jgi:hypothetical protein
MAASFSGDVKWSVVLGKPYGDSAQSPPALLANDRLFFGLPQQAGALLITVQDTTDRIIVALPGDVGMKSVGVAKDGVVYVVTGNPPTLSAIANGRVVWSRNAPRGSFSGDGTQGIAFSPDGLSISVPAYPSPSLYALDLQGNILWADSLGSGAQRVMAVDNNGNLFTWTQDRLVSISPRGDIRWSITTGIGNWDITIDNMGNIAYLAGVFPCSVTNDGKERWKLPADNGDIFTPMISDADGTIYCSTSYSNTDNNVRAVSNLEWSIGRSISLHT